MPGIERNFQDKQLFIKSIVLAAFLLFIGMGSRQTIGLFIIPIIEKTKLTIAQVSLAIAINQLVWGIVQPFWGMMADKGKSFFVLLAGFLILAAANIGIIYADTPILLIITLGLLSPIGAAASGFPILIKIISSDVSAEKRSVASGFINIGGAAGQFTLAPLLQYIINFRGYAASLVFLAGSAIAAIVPSWFLCGKKDLPPGKKNNEDMTFGADNRKEIPLKEQLNIAFHNSGYLMLNCSFFVCGFHVSFLAAHLPSEINLHGFSATITAFCISIIGVCNMIGSIGSGILGKYLRLKSILSAIYFSRALCIALYIMLPKTPLTFFIFAAIYGLTWTATVPPTSGLVGKLLGVRYLATLLGLITLSHQIGAFFGVWLGGIILQKTGSFFWLWCIDMLLALFAALISLPIRESHLKTNTHHNS